MQHSKFVNWWICEFVVSFFDVTNRLKIDFAQNERKIYCFLLFLLTTPTLFSQVNLSNVFIVFLGLFALIAVYFLASPSGTIISDDGTKFFTPIIT